MAGKKIELGPTGEVVRWRVRELRESQNLTYAALSRKLGELGREIPPLGLRRIEAGDRRVDVDDLTALAVALDVSPPALLMPDKAGELEDERVSLGAEDLITLTGLPGPAPAFQVWRWLIAYNMLPAPWVEFPLRSLPKWLRDQFRRQEQDHGDS